ncbi:hypothetical protein M422DRAFT_214865 [Sphaerobolus stellatus SS14]|uniref:Uncharacterized protein n=1 Tax=Sphaerobolus stellatus (strain SS14) TaxID=990650 RepID=A0A0C9U622_SPHS4|nr:hypothetical protein M422DRAFT_214865 [Sphaerobolus stellatus SS14]
MGQRHQAFLIARVIPHGGAHAKYRCIAALQHQCCHGTLPLETASRFLKLVKQPQNAFILREEIRSLNGEFGHEPSITDIPAPYGLFLLQSAFYTAFNDPKQDYSYKKSLLSANRDSTQGHNDGITVLDVTDIEHPRYCFMNTHSNISGITLSASDYVRRCSDSGQESTQFNQRVEESIKLLSKEPLVTYGMLAEAWPHEYEALDSGREVESNGQNININEPSLLELSLKPVLISAIDSMHVDFLEHLMSPRNIAIMKKIIGEDTSLQEKAYPLFSKIVQVELKRNPQTTIDFSTFALPSRQLFNIFTAHPTITSLDISNNPNVTTQTLTELLTYLPNLRRIALFNTGITCEDLKALLQAHPSRFYYLSALLHPAIFNQDDEDLAWSAEYAHVISDGDDKGISLEGASAVSLPFFTPHQVIQSVISLLEITHYKPQRECLSSDRMEVKEPLLQAMYASEFRDESQYWDERVITICPQRFRLPAILRLHGWLFLWKNCWPIAKIAWVRFNTQAIEECPAIRDIQERKARGIAAIEILGERLFEIYDLVGFLQACAQEGRPDVPEDVVRRANYVMTKLRNSVNPSLQPTFEIMTSADVCAFMRTELKRPQSAAVPVAM